MPGEQPHAKLEPNWSPGMPLYPPGTRVEKTGTKPSEHDLHQDGARGTVTGRLGPISGYLVYMVRFDDRFACEIAVAAHRLREVGE